MVLVLLARRGATRAIGHIGREGVVGRHELGFRRARAGRIFNGHRAANRRELSAGAQHGCSQHERR